MTSFFEKRDPWGNGYSLWVLGLLLFTVPLIGFSLKNLRLQNEVETWLPDSDPQVRLLNWYESNFPIDERVLVTWDGSTLGDPRIGELEKLLQGEAKIDGEPIPPNPYIQDVLTPLEGLALMDEQRVEPEDAIDRLTGVLIGQGALKIRLTAEGRTRQKEVENRCRVLAEQALGSSIEVLSSVSNFEEDASVTPFVADSDVAANFDEQDFDPQEKPNDEEEWSNESFFVDHEIDPHDFQLLWPGISSKADATQTLIKQLKELEISGESVVEDCFFQAGAPVTTLVVLSAAGAADKPGALDSIREAAIQVGVPEESIHMGGRPVASRALNQGVIQAAWNTEAPLWRLQDRSLILLSTLVGFVLSFFMIRSFWLSILVLIVSYFAAVATTALIPATGNTMNMVLVVMPTLLSVLTLSGAIHVANYWKHAAHQDRETSFETAFRIAAVPCSLASFTTAIGLASLSTSTLAPVRDFGLYSAVGCGISLLLVLIVLPSLMQLWNGSAPKVRSSSTTGWESFAFSLVRHRTIISVSCLLMFAFSMGGLAYFRTETKVIRYFRDDSEIVKDYRFIEDQVAGIIPVDAIIRFRRDSLEDPNFHFLQRMEIVRRIGEKIREHRDITGAISLADFQPISEEPPPLKSDGQMTWKERLERTKYIRRSNELENQIRSGEMVSSFVTYAKADADLNQPGDHLLSEQGDELWRITAQGTILADNDYGLLTTDMDRIIQEELRYHASANHVVTGLVPIFLRTQQAVLESLIASFGLAFVVIAIVMMVLLRSVPAGLITMVPNLMPIGVVFGCLSWLGFRIDIGTMITASVALGIAVDGTLHLLTWFRDGIRRGMTRRVAIQKGLAHCGPAMFQTSMIVAIGLLMLAPADLLLISRFGILMALLTTAALFADLVLLPALLAGPLGGIIQGVTLTAKSSSPAKTPELAVSPQAARESVASGEQRKLGLA